MYKTNNVNKNKSYLVLQLLNRCYFFLLPVVNEPEPMAPALTLMSESYDLCAQQNLTQHLCK